MKRKDALDAIRAAGTQNDHAAFMRLYVEHRISYNVGKAEFDKGRAIARRFAEKN